MRRRKVYSLILELGLRMESFTPRNLTPALSVDQARRNCLALAEAGELRRVRKGRAGRIIRESVYEVTRRAA